MKMRCMKVVLLVLVTLLAVSFTGCSTKSMTAEDVALVKGTWEGSVYTNTFAGFTYTLPSGWVAATDAEVLEWMDLDPDLLNDEEAYLKALTEDLTVYDFLVQNETTFSSINVLFENLELSFLGTTYTEEEYADVIAETLEEDDYSVGEYEEITIAGGTYLKVPATVTYEGVTVQQNYYVKRQDKFMVVILATCFDEGKTPDDLLAPFAAIQ